MSKLNQSQCSPEQINKPNTGWKAVRPVLRRILLVEIVAVALLLALDTPHAWLIRQKLSLFTFSLAQFQTAVTTLAVVALVAVALEATRVARIRRANRVAKDSRAAQSTPAGAQLA